MAELHNLCRLSGTVHGETWTRWRAPRAGLARGQVRFWLRVPRELAGEGAELLLCAVEPRDEQEVTNDERELAPGRSVELTAAARAAAAGDPDAHGAAAVIFVAELCGFAGAPLAPVHTRPRVGKLAAAGDELLFEGGQS